MNKFNDIHHVYSARRQPPTGRGTASARVAKPGESRVLTAFDSPLGRPENLPGEIAQQLRSRILNESLAPGQRLTNRNSARSLASAAMSCERRSPASS